MDPAKAMEEGKKENREMIELFRSLPDDCYSIELMENIIVSPNNRVYDSRMSQGTGTCHKGTNAEWDNGQAPVTRNIKTPQWDIQSKTWERNN